MLRSLRRCLNTNAQTSIEHRSQQHACIAPHSPRTPLDDDAAGTLQLHTAHRASAAGPTRTPPMSPRLLSLSLMHLKRTPTHAGSDD
jgi:hypothetical protein